MRLKIFAVALIFILLCGCAYAEPDSKYTVTALGFDQKDNKTVYLQAIDTVDGEKNGDPTTFLVKGEGEDFKTALEDIRSQLSKKPSFAHCQLILVTDRVEGESFENMLSLCRDAGISLRTGIAYTEDISAVLESKKIASGADISALIKQNSRYFGYGAHTAVFEIETAIMTAKGGFALPVLTFNKENLKVEGLLRYENTLPAERLSAEESIDYAKEKNTFEGEKS